MKEIDTTCPIGNSISKDVCCEANLHMLCCKKSNSNLEQGSCNSMKEIVEIKVQELCNNEDNFDGGKEIGIVTDGVLYVQNSHDQFPQENKLSNPEEISISNESGCINPFDVKVLKCLSKSATFPSYEVDSSHSYSNLENAAPVRDSSKDYVPEYKRSLSIPARPEKIVSAMKGGRAQNGTSPKMDMHVKWAADVYDPPSTLVSHTVKNKCHHLPKPKKKNSHKHNHKGKNSPRKKVQNRINSGSISEPYPARFQVNPGTEAAESSIDSKCGSIVFLRESLANFHLSIGEAT